MFRYYEACSTDSRNYGVVVPEVGASEEAFKFVDVLTDVVASQQYGLPAVHSQIFADVG